MRRRLDELVQMGEVSFSPSGRAISWTGQLPREGLVTVRLVLDRSYPLVDSEDLVMALHRQVTARKEGSVPYPERDTTVEVTAEGISGGSGVSPSFLFGLVVGGFGGLLLSRSLDRDPTPTDALLGAFAAVGYLEHARRVLDCPTRAAALGIVMLARDMARSAPRAVTDVLSGRSP